MNRYIKTLTILVMVGLAGCGTDPGASFTELMDQGWASFETGEYDAAYDLFTQAQEIDTTSPEAFSALGWTRLKQNNLNSSDSLFVLGSVLPGASAEVFAGHAFVLNALKNYPLSNVRADQAITLDAVWVFGHIPSLDAADIHLIKAENYFALGSFTSSLNEVKILSPGFNVDVATFAGQSQLADKIEQLKISG